MNPLLTNDIFWQNHDQTPSRNGLGVYSATPSHLILNNNLFSGNGQSDSLNWWAAYNVGNGFDLTRLGSSAAAAASNLGNFTGWPAFISPVDPRPGSDGPATFYLSADFGLAANSAAINNALASLASQTDFVGNFQNVNPTSRGFKLPGYGPRDVGAFEYIPTGGTTTPTTPNLPTTPPRTTPVGVTTNTVAEPAPATAVETPPAVVAPIVAPAPTTPAPAPAPTPVAVNSRAAARAAAAAKMAAQRAARQAGNRPVVRVQPGAGLTGPRLSAPRRTPPRFAAGN